MNAAPPIALEARQLVKRYPGVLAVDGVSFSVPEGICFGLLGPNGAGKTTTVEIIEGVTRASSGEVYYYGEIAGARFRQETGIQFQNTALQDHITVRETLEMFRALYIRQADLAHVIEQCSLAELLDRDNRKLSGGQRQRLLLAVEFTRPLVAVEAVAMTEQSGKRSRAAGAADGITHVGPIKAHTVGCNTVDVRRLYQAVTVGTYRPDRMVIRHDVKNIGALIGSYDCAAQ